MATASPSRRVAAFLTGKRIAPAGGSSALSSPSPPAMFERASAGTASTLEAEGLADKNTESFAEVVESRSTFDAPGPPTKLPLAPSNGCKSPPKIQLSSQQRKRGFGLSSLASILWEDAGAKASAKEKLIEQERETFAASPIPQSRIGIATTTTTTVEQVISPGIPLTTPLDEQHTGIIKGADIELVSPVGSRSRIRSEVVFNIQLQPTTLRVAVPQPPTESTRIEAMEYLQSALDTVFSSIDNSLDLKLVPPKPLQQRRASSDEEAPSSRRQQPDFAVYEQCMKEQRWQDALLLMRIAEESSIGRSVPDIGYAEYQLLKDRCRLTALSVIISVDYIQFAQTIRNSRSELKTTVSAPIPFVVPDVNGGFEVSREALEGIAAVLQQAKSICTTQVLQNNGYTFHSVLGSGSTAIVCEVKEDCSNGKCFAAKIVNYQYRSRFETERQVLNHLGNEIDGVGHLHEVFPEFQTIIMSPVGTALNKFPWGSIRTGSPFSRIARALRHLADKGVVHRDVSPGNLILDDSNRLCLIDFGMAVNYAAKGQTYAGSKFFASDSICQALGEDWHSVVVCYEYVDDLESLLKTVLWTLDFDSHGIISRAARGHATPRQPKDVLAMWAGVWKTTVGKRFRKVIVAIRSNPLGAHDIVAAWLEKLGWSQSWTGLA